MTVPSYQALMLPVLKVACKGKTRVPLAADAVADQLGLSNEDREARIPSGRQTVLHNRVHWAKTYMSKAGLLFRPERGVFAITDRGTELLKENPSEISIETLNKFVEFRSFYRPEGEIHDKEDKTNGLMPINIEQITPEEQIDASHFVLDNALRSELLDRIFDQTPAFFENLIVSLLVAMGYGGSHENAALRLGSSGDGGIDGVIDEDRLGLDRIYVQAKRYSRNSPVGRPAVQGFVGSLVGLGASKGVFVTTSNFTQQAKDYVSSLTQRVILIDGDRLAKLMIEFNVGARTHRKVEIKRIDEDFFVE
jgi:restriction system protein